MSGLVYGQRFAQIPDGVLYAIGVSANAKILWAILQRHADPAGACYPGRKRMADLMGVSEETVKRAKAELVKAKLIECTPRFDTGGRRTTDQILLHGGHRSDPYGGVKDDPTNNKAFELDPEEEHHEVKCSSSSIPVWVSDPANASGAGSQTQDWDYQLDKVRSLKEALVNGDLKR